jgi:hypothetical protein
MACDTPGQSREYAIREISAELLQRKGAVMKNSACQLNSALAVVVGLMPLVGTGCCFFGGHPGALGRDVYGDRVVVSPDNSQAAYVWTDQMSCFLLYPIPFSYVRNELVGWSSPDGQENHLLEVQGYSVSFKYPEVLWDHETPLIKDLRYSPDSAHLGVMLDDRIEVIDVRTADRIQLKPPVRIIIRAMRWVSPSEIAYVASVGDGNAWRDPMKKTVFIQDISGASGPTEVFSGEPTAEAPWSPRLFFSPDGQSVLIAQKPEMSILHLSTREVSPLMNADQLVALRAVWKPDGSAVLLIFADINDCPHLYVKDKPINRVVLANLHKGTFTELTDGLKNIENSLKLHVAWAGEDQLVFVQESKVDLFNIDDKGASPAGSWQIPSSWSRDRLRPLLPGWVVAGPTHLRNIRDSYALSYDGKQRAPLSDYHCVVSDDGSHIAEVVRKGKITVRSLDLPPLP